MRDEARDFFARTGQHVYKMHKKRPRDITPNQIEAAAEELYCRIEKGLEIKPLDYWKTIKNIAVDIVAREDDYVQRKAIGEHYRKVCEENDCLRTTNFWLCVALMGMTVAISISGSMLSSVYLGGF